MRATCVTYRCLFDLWGACIWWGVQVTKFLILQFSVFFSWLVTRSSHFETRALALLPAYRCDDIVTLLATSSSGCDCIHSPAVSSLAPGNHSIFCSSLSFVTVSYAKQSLWNRCIGVFTSLAVWWYNVTLLATSSSGFDCIHSPAVSSLAPGNHSIFCIRILLSFTRIGTRIWVYIYPVGTRRMSNFFPELSCCLLRHSVKQQLHARAVRRPWTQRFSARASHVSDIWRTVTAQHGTFKDDCHWRNKIAG